MVHGLLVFAGGVALSFGMAYVTDLFASRFFRSGETCDPPLLQSRRADSVAIR